MSVPTWNFLKQRGIRCESRKSATTLYAYGGKEPLPTLGTFTADVILAGDETGCRADFVVVKGDGRTLLGRETGMDLDILRVGPVQGNSVCLVSTKIEITDTSFPLRTEDRAIADFLS